MAIFNTRHRICVIKIYESGFNELRVLIYEYIYDLYIVCWATAAVVLPQVSFVKEAIMKVLNLVLIFSDRWQAGFGAWK